MAQSPSFEKMVIVSPICLFLSVLRLTLKSQFASEGVIAVVEPDVSVVCDRSKIDKRGCKGAPDLIVEILSPPPGGMIGS